MLGVKILVVRIRFGCPEGPGFDPKLVLMSAYLISVHLAMNRYPA